MKQAARAAGKEASGAQQGLRLVRGGRAAERPEPREEGSAGRERVADTLEHLLTRLDSSGLQQAMDRIRQRVEAEGPAESVNDRMEQLATALSRMDSRFAERFAVRTGARVRLISVDDIDYLEADGNYVRLHVGDRSHLIRGPLSALEAQLDPAVFLRIHRSLVVRIDRVREIEPVFAGEYVLHLRNGRRLSSGRSYRKSVQAAFRF